VATEGQYQGEGPQPIPLIGLRVLPHAEVSEIYVCLLSRRWVTAPHGNTGLLPGIEEKAVETVVEAGLEIPSPSRHGAAYAILLLR